jgi:hypothetical protein
MLDKECLCKLAIIVGHYVGEGTNNNAFPYTEDLEKDHKCILKVPYIYKYSS